MPTSMFLYVSHIAVFKSNNDAHERKTVVGDIDQVAEEVERVNRKAEKNKFYHEIIKL